MEVLKWAWGGYILERYHQKAIPSFLDFSGIVTQYIGFFVMRYAIFKVVYALFWERICDKYKDFKTRSMRMRRLQKLFVALFFHAIITGWMFYMFGKEDWWFFTTGRLGSVISVNTKVKFGYRFFYVICCSYYSFDSIILLVSTLKYGREKDFVEMLIHHILTLVLLFTSFLTAQLKIGILVLFVHNVSDVHAYITRIISVIKVGGIVKYSFQPFTIFFWFFFRAFMLPYFAMPPAISLLFFSTSELFFEYKVQYALMFQNVTLLFILYIMNLYWGLGIVRITVTNARKTIVMLFKKKKKIEKKNSMV